MKSSTIYQRKIAQTTNVPCHIFRLTVNWERAVCSIDNEQTLCRTTVSTEHLVVSECVIWIETQICSQTRSKRVYDRETPQHRQHFNENEHVKEKEWKRHNNFLSNSFECVNVKHWMSSRQIPPYSPFRASIHTELSSESSVSLIGFILWHEFCICFGSSSFGGFLNEDWIDF